MRYWHPAIVQNDTLILTEPEDFATDLYMDFTINLLDRSRNQPSMVYLPLHIPHGTSIVVQQSVSKIPTTPAGGRPGTNYGGSMKEAPEYIDIAIGNLLAGLGEKNLLENTIIIFTGDNGDSGDPTAVLPGKVRST